MCQIMNAAEKVCHELFMAEGRGMFKKLKSWQIHTECNYIVALFLH